MLLQRTSRHKLFAKNDASAAAGGSASEDGSERKYALRCVDFLLGKAFKIVSKVQFF
jgi:hypothetical protein